MTRQSAGLESGTRARVGAAFVTARGTGSPVAPGPNSVEDIASEVLDFLSEELVRRADEIGVAEPERHREAVRSRLRGAGLLG